MSVDGGGEGVESLLVLGSTLQSLPDEKFLAVIDKLAIVSQMAPVVAIFDEARPRMRLLKPHRPRSLQRPMCRPFEDLFAARAQPASDSLLDRSVIGPLWRHLEASEGDAMRSLQTVFKRTLTTEPQKTLDVAEQLWRIAARVLAKAPVPGLDEEVSALLRDLMLAAIPIEGFKRRYPLRPLGRFAEGEKAMVKEQLDSPTATAGSSRGYLVAVAARLASPTELLCWLREAGRQVPPILERFALGKVADSIAQFEQRIDEDDDPEGLAARAQDLLAILDSADAGTSGGARAAVKEQAEAVKQKVRAALKAQVIDAASTGIAAALSNDASRDSLLAAEGYARALAKTRKSAGKLGIGTATDTAIQSVRRNCLGRIDDLLRPAPPSADPAADYARTRTQVFQSVRLIELVDGASSGREVLADAQRRLKALPR